MKQYRALYAAFGTPTKTDTDENWLLVNPCTREYMRIPNRRENQLLLWLALNEGWINASENEFNDTQSLVGLDKE